ncbi:MAG TPA: hypothetical protein VKR58_06000 [Aquella sp.]|nr:hypothetical protein [Aquella sp.]
MAYDHDISQSTAATSKDSSDYGIYTRVICQGQGTGNYNVGTSAAYSATGGGSYAGSYKTDQVYRATTGISTTVTGVNTAGSKILNMGSTTGILPGMSLYINIGVGPTFQVCVVDFINSTTQVGLINALSSTTAGTEIIHVFNTAPQGNAYTAGTVDYFINQIFDTQATTPEVTFNGNTTPPFDYGRIYDSESSLYTRSWTMADSDIFWVDLGRNPATGNAWLIDFLQITSFNPFKDNTTTPTVPQTVYIYYMTEEDFVAQTGYYPPVSPATVVSGKAIVDPILYNWMGGFFIRDSSAWTLLTDVIQMQDGQTNIDVSQFIKQRATKLRFLKIRCTQPWYQFPNSGITGGRAAFVMSGFNVWLSRNIVRTAEYGYSPNFNSTANLATRATLMRRTMVLENNIAITDGTTAAQFALNDLTEMVTDFVPINFAVEVSPLQLFDTVQYIDAETNITEKFFVSEITLNRNGPHTCTAIDYSAVLQ